MKILYFDCFSGISGDMAVGALMDLGIDREVFLNELSKLGIGGYKVEISTKNANGIVGTDVKVILDDAGMDTERDSYAGSYGAEMGLPGIGCPDAGAGLGVCAGMNDHTGEHADRDVHAHAHTDACAGAHAHIRNGAAATADEGRAGAHAHAHAAGRHLGTGARNLSDIAQIFEQSGLSSFVKSFSMKVFAEIAAAEAKVHGKPVDEVHFHEVGALDSIIDIAGTAICLELLGVERIFSSALHDGTGFVECAHGMLPVPVPAVMEMLAGSGIPLITEDIGTELITPTGMGLIKCMASEFGNMPPMTIKKVGYGLGKRNTGRFNALRAILGETCEKQLARNDEIAVLETNMDDSTGEVLGYTMSRLIDAGALDAFYTPVYMKKCRPAYMLTVLAARGTEENLVKIIFEETSTLGIRIHYTKRYVMDRQIVKVSTDYGEARVKVSTCGSVEKASPEYEDCRRIAETAGLPLIKAYGIVASDAARKLGMST